MKKDARANFYFILSAYLASWLIWSICFFTGEEVAGILRMAGTFAPSIAALIITFTRNKSEGVQLLKSAINVKIGVKSYLYIFLTLPLIIAISYLIMTISKVETPSASFKIFELPLVFLYIFALMGPLGEELGWRGFLQPKLLKNTSPLITSIIIGVIWSLWHLPLFFIEGSLQYSLAESYGYLLSLIGYFYYTTLLTVFITIIFLKTKMNVLSALLIHTVANLSIGMMPLIFNQTGAILQLSVMTIVVLIIAIINKKYLLNKSKETRSEI